MQALQCTITLRNEPLAEKIFLSEEKEFNHKRSKYRIETKGKDTIITIDADDPIALRATITSVTRVLQIIKELKK